jgi:two-component system sensor histidine kinase/response regulator
MARRILIVEDELVVACHLTDTLEDLGYAVVDAVATGEEAVHRARTLRPTAILMDIRLAGAMDGIQAAAQIRSERDIPIVFLSAHAGEDTLQRATATEPFGYLVKPFKPTELRCALEIALRQHAMMARLRDPELRPRRTTEPPARDPGRDPARDPEIDRRVRERTAQLEAANRELEAFSYSVAHDLRSPLRGIQGFSEILIEDHGTALGTEALGHVVRVQGAARRMNWLIEDLLELSRTAQAELRRAPVDLARLAREIAGRLQAAEPARAVSVAIADPISVIGDERLLGVALENLIGNAWKFTAQRSPATIEIGTVAHGGATACFVRDNGAGFDVRQADKLFTAFQRFHSMAEFEGSGVGLAIVQRIIQRHGGRIWADSAVGAGTTMYFAI